MCNEEDVERLEEELKGKPPEEQWKLLLDVREYLLNVDEEEISCREPPPSSSPVHRPTCHHPVAATPRSRPHPCHVHPHSHQEASPRSRRVTSTMQTPSAARSSSWALPSWTRQVTWQPARSRLTLQADPKHNLRPFVLAGAYLHPCRRSTAGKYLSAFVSPCFVTDSSTLANINGATNAVQISSTSLQDSTFVGQGACLN